MMETFLWHQESQRVDNPQFSYTVSQLGTDTQEGQSGDMGYGLL